MDPIIDSAATDTEWRPLRPIGLSATEVTDRTGRLLTRLTDRPGVHLFTKIPVAGGQNPITHALSAGRLILFVESVAWPPGRYTVGPDDRVRCDDIYIGQSVRPLLDAVLHLRRTLPDDYRIGGVVVVHPTGPVAPTLPASGPVGLSWLPPGDLTARMRRRLGRALYCRSDINAVTLRWSPTTEGYRGA